MKSYDRFKKDLTEAVPLAAPLLAPLVPKILGGAAAAVGLGGMIHQATKQGQGGRSQPSDYGQGGTARPRGKSVQRGKLSSNDAYNRAKAEEKRREREQRRSQTPASQSPSSTELGRKADEVLKDIRDKEYAKQRRENPDLLKKEAQQRRQQRLDDIERSKVDPKLERAADQVLRDLRK